MGVVGEFSVSVLTAVVCLFVCLSVCLVRLSCLLVCLSVLMSVCTVCLFLFCTSTSSLVLRALVAVFVFAVLCASCGEREYMSLRSDRACNDDIFDYIPLSNMLGLPERFFCSYSAF